MDYANQSANIMSMEEMGNMKNIGNEIEKVEANENKKWDWDVLYDSFVEELNSKYGLKIKLSEKDRWDRDINRNVYCSVVEDIFRLACKKPSVTFNGVRTNEKGEEVLEDVKFAWNKENELEMRIRGWGKKGSVGYCLKELVDRIGSVDGWFVFRKWNWEAEKVEYKVVGFGNVRNDCDECKEYENYEKEDEVRVREWVEWKCVGDKEWRKVEIVWMGRDGVWWKV